MVTKTGRQDMLWFCSFEFPYFFIGVPIVSLISLLWHSVVHFVLFASGRKGQQSIKTKKQKPYYKPPQKPKA
jgi:hypothetical protein